MARQVARRGLPSPLPYPDDLPITARKGEILSALAANQVIVVAGETGSGKSTQLPKMCLEAGRGTAGLIGHTQPRRIAARSLAERVADELGVPLGGAVGYKVRFTDRVSDGTLVKLMTDGVLLAELHGEPDLRPYDTLIIDEAHERSLNIDFILGYLKRLLPSRADLKVIITSATIDTARFSEHFGDAPVIEVSGRAYPVEIRYRPVLDGGDADDDMGPGLVDDGPSRDGGRSDGDDAGPADEVEAVCHAVAELCGEGPGDILVFLPGEREVRDTAEALAKTDRHGLEVLPLYGRLSSAEQHRIFEPHTRRRAVLATNVAETSLTVPGVRYVVDTGTARISRYSRRTKVQRLPIEAISQASANQRAGRCGRLGPGICTRLYSEEDFNARRPFTEPEVLRTNLASVVLQMAAIGLGEIEDFPFVDPPDRRNVKDGIALLEELGALSRWGPPGEGARAQPAPAMGPAGWRLTEVGRQLAQLPLDPRLGRMVLEAARLGCLDEVLVIAAGLSVQDPRERPAEKREAAAALHARFDDRALGFPVLPVAVGLPGPGPGRAQFGAVPPALTQGAHLLPAGPRVAGRPRPARRDLPASCAWGRRRQAAAGVGPDRRLLGPWPRLSTPGDLRGTRPRPAPPGRTARGGRCRTRTVPVSIRPCSPAWPPRSAPARATTPTLPPPGVLASPFGRGPSWPRPRPAGSWPPSWWRRGGCGRVS